MLGKGYKDEPGIIYMRFNIFGKKGQSIEISGINLYWKGSMHTLNGVSAKQGEFEVVIPFRNKKDESLSFLKRKKKAAERLERITADKPFTILEISPTLPLEIEEGESKEIRIKLKGPDFGYSGILTLKMYGPEEERIHLEIPEVFLKRGERKVKVNEHGEVYNLLKNQVFEVSVQMYKLLTLHDMVNVVKLNAPFEFEGTEPKLPFELADPSSFLVTFMIKAPDFDYSGPLEIEV